MYTPKKRERNNAVIFIKGHKLNDSINRPKNYECSLLPEFVLKTSFNFGNLGLSVGSSITRCCKFVWPNSTSTHVFTFTQVSHTTLSISYFNYYISQTPVFYSFSLTWSIPLCTTHRFHKGESIKTKNDFLLSSHRKDTVVKQFFVGRTDLIWLVLNIGNYLPGSRSY